MLKEVNFRNCLLIMVVDLKFLVAQMEYLSHFQSASISHV